MTGHEDWKTELWQTSKAVEVVNFSPPAPVSARLPQPVPSRGSDPGGRPPLVEDTLAFPVSDPSLGQAKRNAARTQTTHSRKSRREQSKERESGTLKSRKNNRASNGVSQQPASIEEKLSGPVQNALALPDFMQVRPENDQQRKILQWAEHLHKELVQTERERASLDQKLAESQAERVRLRMELEKMRQRSAELEKATHQGKDAGDAFSENDYLRKQLGAYAVEIERLRVEKESGEVDLSKSRQALQHLSREKDELHRAHEELQQKHKIGAKQITRLSQMHGKERDSRQKLESQLEVHGDTVQASLDAAQASLQEEYTKVSETLRESEQSHREKDARVRGLVEILNDTMGVVHELQDNYVKQTRAYHMLSKEVRAQQDQLLQDVQEAEQLAFHSEQFAGELTKCLSHAKDMNSASEESWQREAERLQQQLHQTTENHRAAAEQVRAVRKAHQDRTEKLQKRAEEEKKLAEQQAAEEAEALDKKRSRHGVMNNPNIVKQMAEAVSGIYLEKVDSKGRREKRMLKVVCSIKTIRGRGQAGQAPDMQLRWAKAPFTDFADRSACNLEEVMSIAYGFASRAWWLFPDQTDPTCCFTVNTPKRSFDFICENALDAEAFVLVISRLCSRIQGWPLGGGVLSHSKFQCLKGWTKVQAACRKSKNTMITHFLQAAAKAVRPAQQERLANRPKTAFLPLTKSTSSLSTPDILEAETVGTPSAALGNPSFEAASPPPAASAPPSRQVEEPQSLTQPPSKTVQELRSAPPTMQPAQLPAAPSASSQQARQAAVMKSPSAASARSQAAETTPPVSPSSQAAWKTNLSASKAPAPQKASAPQKAPGPRPAPPERQIPARATQVMHHTRPPIQASVVSSSRQSAASAASSSSADDTDSEYLVEEAAEEETLDDDETVSVSLTSRS
mmetsp:Transcript_73731/g.130173  ORF Transcript_73731/g.130173 Transcript_73731/m.130173 type:complete len:911 (-) Transcript_73731:10-2742(-)